MSSGRQTIHVSRDVVKEEDNAVQAMKDQVCELEMISVRLLNEYLETRTKVLKGTMQSLLEDGSKIGIVSGETERLIRAKYYERIDEIQLLQQYLGCVPKSYKEECEG